MHYHPKFLQKPPPIFSMVHLLHRLYGVDTPASRYCFWQYPFVSVNRITRKGFKQYSRNLVELWIEKNLFQYWSWCYSKRQPFWISLILHCIRTICSPITSKTITNCRWLLTLAELCAHHSLLVFFIYTACALSYECIWTLEYLTARNSLDEFTGYWRWW